MTMLRCRCADARLLPLVAAVAFGACDGSTTPVVREGDAAVVDGRPGSAADDDGLPGSAGPSGRDGDVSTPRPVADAAVSRGDGGADAGGEEDPPCERDYDVIEARGQTIVIESGETFENVLFDLSTGNDVVLVAKGTNWAIRNIGYRGMDRSDKGRTFMGLADTGGGTSTVDNVYLGDGSTDGNAQPTGHGKTGIWIDPKHSGRLDIRHVNVQGMADNGMYASAPGSNSNGERGTIHIDQCFAANNYVSSYRIANGSSVTDSVAFNSAGEGYNGRCFWGWPGSSEMTISGCDFDSGPYPDAIHVGRAGRSTSLRIEETQYDGIQERGAVDITYGDGNGSDPDLSIPEGVPMSAVEAASGCH